MPQILLIFQLTIELHHLLSLPDGVLADTSVRAKVSLVKRPFPLSVILIVAKLVYHLLQLLNDQDQLELVSVELVLLNYELLVCHDHLTSPKSPIVDRFWPSLANKLVLISKPSEQASCNRHYTTIGSPLQCK